MAVKVLHADTLADPTGLARFEREARAAAALGHPNIAQVLDFDANPSEPFLVLELLCGRTSNAALVGERAFSPERAVAIAGQILAALEAADAAGIVHRDVKPANVFLVGAAGHADFVKLLDFGIGKLTPARTRTETRRTPDR